MLGQSGAREAETRTQRVSVDDGKKENDLQRTQEESRATHQRNQKDQVLEEDYLRSQPNPYQRGRQ